MTAWTPRQTAMLAEMGIAVWPERESAAATAAGAVATSVVDALPVATPVVPAATVAPVVLSTTRRSAASPDGPAPTLDRLDWLAVRDAAAACVACGLCDGRTRSVFGDGRPGAHWLVVGEPPDDADDAAGAAYAGRAGQLLDNMLRAVGVSRLAGDRPAAPDAAAASTVPVVKCHPPHGRPATAAEVGTCRGYLMRQVELLRPRVVLAMGRWAAFSLLGTDEPLGRLRGRVHQVAGVAVVVTYDPAYLLRNPQDKAKAWADLCLAAETVAVTL